jgi:hypothetical protein
MENCPNCNKIFKTRGIKLHLRKCNQIKFENETINNILIQKENEKEIEKKKFFNNCNFILPDDCIKIIYEYLMLKDKHTTFYRLYKNINNLSLVSKAFYLNKPIITDIDKNIFINEQNETICKSWSKDIYNLTDEDLNELDYKVKNTWSYTVYLYKLTEIKDIAYYKYGTEYQYNIYTLKINNFKLLSTKEKNIIKNNRLIQYNNLFEKYNYLQNEIILNLYNNNLTYIKKEVPLLEHLEKRIIFEFEKQDRCNNLNLKLKELNLTNTEKDISNEYIQKNKYSLEYIISKIQNKLVIYNNFIKILNDKNIIVDTFYEKIAKLISDNEKICNINNIIDLINNIDFYKKYMNYDSIIKKYYNNIDCITINNIKYSFDKCIEEWCYYIENLENIDFIIPTNIINNVKKIYQKVFKHKEELKLELEKKKNSLCNICLINDFARTCKIKNCGKCCKDIECNRHSKNKIKLN